MMGFGPWEVAAVAAVFLLLFPGRLRIIGRDLGRTVGILRRTIDNDE